LFMLVSVDRKLLKDLAAALFVSTCSVYKFTREFAVRSGHMNAPAAGFMCDMASTLTSRRT
jgi:hypothetical protein